MASRVCVDGAMLVFAELAHTARKESGCNRGHCRSGRNTGDVRERKRRKVRCVVDIWGTAARLATACGKVRSAEVHGLVERALEDAEAVGRTTDVKVRTRFSSTPVIWSSSVSFI
jgi:hypothetical protein